LHYRNEVSIPTSDLKQQISKYKHKNYKYFNYFGPNEYLFNSCDNGNENSIRYFVERGADINKENINGLTPYHFSCENENENIVRYLVKHGADINKENEYGFTPIHYACRNGNKNLFRYLVEYGVDINKKIKMV